ncbi:MAG: (2Fe-2S) ferredoxin domain-containing protein [Candidatus Omnitrophica bacterium]|nr:(2Fe-2S) ferredoxin domain-containing protein [Candidatus Omnitrophota bacterium]
METNPTPYKRQIFVCTNDRKGESASCGDHQGEEVFRRLREIAKERKLHPTIRVTQAKCLGQCAKGVNIMIYPKNVWYSAVRLEDVSKIADECIKV